MPKIKSPFWKLQILCAVLVAKTSDILGCSSTCAVGADVKLEGVCATGHCTRSMAGTALQQGAVAGGRPC